MPKSIFLAVAAVVVAILLGLAHATKFTITTTVDEDEEFHQRGGQRGPPLEKKRDCEFEIGRGIRFLRYYECYLHILKGAHDCGETGTPMIDIDPDVLYEIPCCKTLQGMPEECRCGAVRAVLRMLQKDWLEEGMEEMKKLASFLPRVCHVVPQQCQV